MLVEMGDKAPQPFAFDCVAKHTCTSDGVAHQFCPAHSSYLRHFLGSILLDPEKVAPMSNARKRFSSGILTPAAGLSRRSLGVRARQCEVMAAAAIRHRGTWP